MKVLVGKNGLVVNIVNFSAPDEGEKLWLVDDAFAVSVGDAFDDKARQVDDVAVAIFQVLFRHENMIRQLVRAVRTNAQISTAATTAGLPTTANAPDLTLAQAKAAFKNLIRDMDLFNISEGRATVRIFTYNAVLASVSDVQAYEIPRNHSLVYFLLIGGGGGGGNGFTRTTGNDGGGGGGGGSGAMVRLLIPRVLIPDVVFVRVGAGSGVVGTNALQTYVMVRPLVGLGAGTVIALASGGNTGATGTATAAGGAGAGGSITNIHLDTAFFGCGVMVAVAGQAGGAGGAHTGATGTAVAFGAGGLPLSGGAGGGGSTGVNFAGGDITGAGLVPTIPGGALAAATNPGVAGYSVMKPFFHTGGSGGNTHDAGVAGNGGNGGIGCGAGGGGAGATGGTGGRGGDGLVIIASW